MTYKTLDTQVTAVAYESIPESSETIEVSTRVTLELLSVERVDAETCSAMMMLTHVESLDRDLFKLRLDARHIDKVIEEDRYYVSIDHSDYPFLECYSEEHGDMSIDLFDMMEEIEELIRINQTSI